MAQEKKAFHQEADFHRWLHHPSAGRVLSLLHTDDSISSPVVPLFHPRPLRERVNLKKRIVSGRLTNVLDTRSLMSGMKASFWNVTENVGPRAWEGVGVQDWDYCWIQASVSGSDRCLITSMLRDASWGLQRHQTATQRYKTVKHTYTHLPPPAEVVGAPMTFPGTAWVCHGDPVAVSHSARAHGWNINL